jgi:ribosomal 50S subunit-recycling heat shock protein
MRLDLFLKTSRLVIRRSVAQEFCDAGLINVNEAPAKSSKEVKAGDVIEIRRPTRSTKVLVVEVPDTKQVSKKSASQLYQILEETALEDDTLI